MKALFLFLFFLSFSLLYQNCAENPEDFNSTGGLTVTCLPEDKCLKYSLHMGATTEGKESVGVCIDTKPTDNGLVSEAKFSQGCSYYSAACSYCNLNNSHQVSFSVAEKDSKVGIDQSITINFTPDGKEQVIDY